MKVTKDSIIQLFQTVRNKKGLLNYVSQNPHSFRVLLELTTEENTPEAWRAAWLVGHTMKENDQRLLTTIDTLIEHLEKAKEGHQRQLIIILLNMELNNEQEGNLFDRCLSIWEHVNCIPSTRVTAMKFILKIVGKFPDLKPEIILWTQDMYLDSLSPGIKNSVLKQVKNIL
tara:strand:+ start:7244 stop:7759 length:516 start_codon:yes stop_codon:yes gene_type:complete